MRKLLMVLAVLPLLMAGKCAPVSGITCPDLRQYSPAYLQKVAAQYRQIETTMPELAGMIDDYGIERAAIRECIKRRAK